MSHIVFITGNFFPNHSSNGICIQNVIDILKIEHEISVIAFHQNLEQPFVDRNDSIDIYNIYNWKNELRIKAENNLFIYGSTFFNKFLKYFIRAFIFIDAIISLPVIRKDIINSYLKILQKIIQIKKIDLVIPVCFPFESIIAAVKFREENHKYLIIPYLFDSYPESISLNRGFFLSRIKRKCHYNTFYYFLNKTDYVLAMNSFKDKLSLRVPYEFIEHPLLNNFELSNEFNSDSTIINMIYAGSFNRNVRNPWTIINYIKKLNLSEKSIVLKFFVKGDFEKELLNIKDTSKLYIQVEKPIPFQEVLKHLNSSDFLINISDEAGIQISGKIFTYISLGKPIINFYKSKDDNTKKILDNYPLGLSIGKYTPVNQLEQFIIENKNRKIPYCRIKKMFPEAIPDYTASLINEITKRITEYENNN